VEPSAKITRSIKNEEVTRQWWVIDASGKTVGRLASQVAVLLRGKHKPSFTPHVDCGDFVIITNAGKIQLKGKRIEQKEYFHYTGYPGGVRFEKFKDVMKNKPEFVLEHAIRGMIPKNKLGRKIIKKLKLYSGSEHPHSAQKPQEFELKYNC
jgi:large subunit ribosomal protein L13